MAQKKHLVAIALVAVVIALVALALPQGDVEAAPQEGTPDIRSIGSLAFGPENILFVGDSLGARLFAVEIDDGVRDSGTQPVEVDRLDRKLAALLGTTSDNVHVGDLVVHPVSQRVYFSVSRGTAKRGWGRYRGEDSTPLLMRLSKDGSIEEVSLRDVRYTQTQILPSPSPDAKTRRGIPLRTFTVLDMNYVDGYVYLSGLSNEEFSSRLRRISYPFDGSMESNSLEIFHTAHGRYETHAPINAFAPYTVADETKILGAFSCTPLVTFPLDQKDEAHVKGTTVAELGAGNHPLDIISYDQGGETYFLLANHLHPFMKILSSDIAHAKGLTRPTNGAGASVKKLPQKGIVRLAELNAEYVVALQRDESTLNLFSIAKGSL